MTKHRYTNRLAGEASPYLLQHAHNPVDWYPWGEEALAKAREEDKPVLLSVGYAACHWCHVMEHESFEDEATAQIMNQHFVSIKVDREERPDIDNVYMTAVQAMTGGGGWPMTVFLTPDGVPFYGGTYYPPEDRYNIPSFKRVLLSLADAYQNRRDELLQAGTELLNHIRQATATALPEGVLDEAVLDQAVESLAGMFDAARGGFGGAPKFPQPMTYEFLLRYAARTGAPAATQMTDRNLRAMAEGGIYDQIGGGFHRYSVDANWLVPHFEKMLYDNALLARVYTEMFQASGDPFFRRIAEETLDYMVREMRHPAGGFYSTQDADSLPDHEATHKEEGAFFVWTPAELRAALGGDAMLFGQLFDVTERGNFEGKNILHVLRRPADVARVTGQSAEKIDALVEHSKRALFAARAARPAPALDDKVLTAWNGMALRAFAGAAAAFGRDDYRAIAEGNADFVLHELRRDGVLLRVWKDRGAGDSRQADKEQRDKETGRQKDQAPQLLTPNPQLPTPAFLEDHALLADGLLALYEATFEPRWLLAARDLADVIVARFWSDAIGGFYDTASDHEALIVRPRDTGDNATPSGNAAAAAVLLHLATIFDNADYRAKAVTVLGGMAQFMAQYPTGFGRYLAAAEYALGTPKEIVIVGEPQAADTQALLQEVRRLFLPNKVVLLLDPAAPPNALSELPLLQGRTQINGKATAYVCENYACKLPATDVAVLREQLT